MTLSITTLSLMTLCRYAECHCAECRDLFIVMLNVIMLSVVMLYNFINKIVIFHNPSLIFARKVEAYSYGHPQ